MNRILSMIAVAGLAFAGTSNAQVWNEDPGGTTDFGAGGNDGSIQFGGGGGDLAQSQVTVGTGPLTAINGTLRSGEFDADPYVITVTDPGAFTATYTTTSPTSPGYIPQLALFDVNTFQAYAGVEGGTLTGSLLPSAGQYILLVGTSETNPANLFGEGLFDFGATPGVTAGPDPLIASDVWAFYNGGFAAFANETYTVSLTGAGFAEVPAPGVAGLLAAAGFAATRRRRA